MFTRQTIRRRIAGASAFCAATLALSGSAAGQTHFDEARALEMLGFGSDVAIASGRLFVGEPGRIMGPGTVFQYEETDDGWAEVAQITALDGRVGDGFGSVLATDGETLLIGAPAAGQGVGLVYVYERDESTGEFLEVGVFGPEEATVGGYGTGISVHGDWAAIGWPGFGQLTGRVDLLHRTEDGWDLARQIVPETPQTAFGAAVTVAEGRLLVGAPVAGGGVGSVVEYRLDGEAEEPAELLGELVPAGVLPGALFGAAVEFDGERLAVSAPNQSLTAGRVLVFRHDPVEGAWEQIGELSSPEGPVQDAFGVTFGLTDDGSLWIGSPGGNGATGAAFVFGTSASGEWAQAETVLYEDAQRGDAFGVSLGVDPNAPLAAVSALGAANQAGVVVIYGRSDDGTWSAVAEIASEPETLDPTFAEPAECSDGNASGFECTDVDLVSFVPVSAMGGGRGIQLNDMWGWEDPETGRLYAIVGRTDGTSFMDVTDPSNPVYLGDLPRTDGTPVASWRDMKVYRNHAYIVADGSPGHGMQIFDLTRLRDLDGTDPPVFDEDAVYEGVSSAHNVFINEESGFGYIIGVNGGGETCGGGLHMVDLNEPTAPVFAGCFSDPLTGRSNTGYSHDVQCVMYDGPDEDYTGREICFGSNETALSIADVTDKTAPVAISRASYPAVAYAHQGWLNEGKTHFFLGDELDEQASEDGRTRTMVWDVSDLDDPILATEYFSTEVATDHNLYVRGNFMYQSNYEAGLRIVDISDPLNPVEVAFFDTVPYRENTPEMSGSWTNYPFFDNGVVLVTSRWEGLFILKKREPITE